MTSTSTRFPPLSAASQATVDKALAMVAESRPRMDSYTEEQREELERDARARIAAGRADASPRDWVDDFAHENGNYMCRCCHCHETFTGHKRRVSCKVCAERAQAKADNRAAWLREAGAPPNWNILTTEEVCTTYAEVGRLVLEVDVERNLRRELAEALKRLIDCISETRGKNAHYALLDGQETLAKSVERDAEIAAQAAAAARATKEKAAS